MDEGKVPVDASEVLALRETVRALPSQERRAQHRPWVVAAAAFAAAASINAYAATSTAESAEQIQGNAARDDALPTALDTVQNALPSGDLFVSLSMPTSSMLTLLPTQKKSPPPTAALELPLDVGLVDILAEAKAVVSLNR